MSDDTCIFPGCSTLKIVARGLCSTHYGKVRKAGQLDAYANRPRQPKGLKVRFERIGWTETSSGCWEWNGALNSHGYGQISQGPRSADGSSKPLIASRVAWELNHGPIAEEMCVCHACDNPRCVNPAHLFLGTKHKNNSDMAMKRRSRNGERRPQFKLADFQVETMRSLYAAGGISQAELARQFGISQAAVSMIISGQRRPFRTYRDVA